MKETLEQDLVELTAGVGFLCYVSQSKRREVLKAVIFRLKSIAGTLQLIFIRKIHIS